MIKRVAAVAVSGMLMFTMSACGGSSDCEEEEGGSFLGTKVADAKPSSSSGGSRASSPSSKGSASGSKQGSGKSSSKSGKSKVKGEGEEEELNGNQKFNNAKGKDRCDD